jgi:hypothetical protein
MIKMTVWVRTGMVGSKVETSFEISKKDFDSMSETKIEELAFESMNDLIDWNFDVEDIPEGV